MASLITGIGVISPLGQSLSEHLNAINEKRTAFSKISLYDTTGAKATVAGEIKNLDTTTLPNRKLAKMVTRKDLLGIVAADAAIRDAQLLESIPNQNQLRRGAFIGSCSTNIGDFIPYFAEGATCFDSHRIFDSNKFGSSCLSSINPLAAVKVLLNGCLAHVCQLYGIKGANANIMDGAVSGLKALAFANDLINSGHLDWALVGALSAPIDPFQMSAAYTNGRLADAASHDLNAPLNVLAKSARGTFLTEGAAFFILESTEHFKTRGISRTPYAQLGSYATLNHPDEQEQGRFIADQLRQLPATGLAIVPATGERSNDLLHQRWLDQAHYKCQISTFGSLLGDLGEVTPMLNLALGVRLLHADTSITGSYFKSLTPSHVLTYARNTAGQLMSMQVDPCRL